jgi:hypothetical protein
MPSLASAAKCLYCIWPILVVFVAWLLCKGVDSKVYFGSLAPGMDPLSSAGQTEFETRHLKDREKRRIILWAGGIILTGYLGYFLVSSFTVRASAQTPTALPTASITATHTQAVTPTLDPPSATPVPTTPTLSTPSPSRTYVPTATDRIVYVAGKDVVQVVTVVVVHDVWVTVIVTETPTDSPEPTGTPTPSSTLTPTLTGTDTPTGTLTPTGT